MVTQKITLNNPERFSEVREIPKEKRLRAVLLSAPLHLRQRQAREMRMAVIRVPLITA